MSTIRIRCWICTLSVLTLIHKQSIKVCEATLCSPPCLLVSNTSDIVAIDYKTAAFRPVISGLTRAVALDVHFSLGYIFWSDVTEQNIKRFQIGGSTTTIITGIGVCDGLAVDWRSSQLYWSDTTYDAISISDLSGNNQRTLINLGLDEPREIALDLDSSLMFWTDWGASEKIEKASLNGNQRLAIVTTYLYFPNGIELDKGNKRIFWVDAGYDRVESVDYNGNNRKQLFQQSGLHPFGVTLIPPFLFFTDWNTHQEVHQLDAITGKVLRSYSINGGKPMGIVAYDYARQPPASSPCVQNNGGCSHFCVEKASGYECVCPIGFTVKSDNKTCIAGARKFIMFADADDKSTNYISLDVNYFISQTLFNHVGNQRPIALDFDPVEDRVYWTDVEHGRIFSAFFNATSLRTLFHCNVKTPDGLAIDHVGRNIYWTDTGTNRIEVGRLDGTRRKLLIKDGLDEPRAIVLDERYGMMYWTDWGVNPKIEQAEMDGSARRIIVTGNLAWPFGLTIDQATNRLFWADAQLDKIEMSNLNGGNRQLIMSSAANILPYGLAVYQNMLYWTDWNYKSISRYNLSSGKQDMVVTGLKKPMDIHVFDPSLIFSGPHNCSQNNGLCSDFCLLKSGGYRCACPTGIALKPDGKTCDYGFFHKTSSEKFMIYAEAYVGKIYKIPLAVPDTPCLPLGIETNISRPIAVDYDPVERKIYWSDVNLKLLARAFPNGSSVEVIAYNNVDTPDGLAVDYVGRNIYWTDKGTSKIEIARLDGSYRRTLISSSVDNPRAILLDIAERKMYWSDWGSFPKIEQANMDSSSRTTLVSSGLVWVNSLALDFQNRLLYWCDASLDKIERVDLQGNNRALILDLSLGSRHPFGLAVSDDALYWSDWNNRSIHKYNMTTFMNEVVIHGMGTPMELHIYDHSKVFSGSTTCTQLNGGCSHICLPNPNGHRCFCPEGVQLKPGDAFTCQGVNRCPQLSAPAHGSLEPCSNLPGQTCQFSCDRGHVLTGSTTRTCNSDGTWTGTQPQCNAVTCPALAIPSNGIRKSCTGITIEYYNTVCQFSCYSGYTGIGSPSRKCLANGTWSGQDFLCQAVTCPSLSVPPRTILLTTSCGNTYGSNCVFGCQSGFGSADGNVTRTCLNSGQWSGNDINCTDIFPPTFGATCPSSPLVVYAERGLFSAQVSWTEPVASDNSGEAVSVTSNYQPPHRFPQGTHVIKYIAMDQSGNEATCTFVIKVIVINCTSLTLNPGGPLRMSSCGNHFGAQCNFSCSIGYRLNGSSTVACVAHGNKPPGFWVNPLPSCQAITCPSLTAPANGAKTGCTNIVSEPYGTRCSFSCIIGYSLLGSSVRRCLENETWSGETSHCQAITCGPLVRPIDVVISPSSCLSSSNYAQTCRFTCQIPGYDLEGTSVRVCGNDGHWTGSNDTRCRDNTPPSFNNTCPNNMVFYAPECSSSAVLTWIEPVATDNSGHVSISYPAIRPPVKLSIGLYNVLYSATDNSGNRANCTFIVQVARKSCPTLQPPVHGSITSLSCGTSFGSQASLSCDTGYRMTGSSQRSCQADGTWSGNTTICNVIKCPAILTSSHVTVLPSTCKIPSGVHYQTECIFKCNITVGYRLEGVPKVSCLENGSWSTDANKTICRDFQAPSIKCPPDMDNIPTEPGQSYANVTWQAPVPTDNSNEPPKLSGLMPPQKLNVGKNHIIYKATDSSGLSESCKFVIEVKDLEPPKFASCPDHIHKTSVKKMNKIYLPGVTVTDNVGVHLFTTSKPNGSKFTWGEHNITYTAKDKAGNTAKCYFQIIIAGEACPDLPIPMNGAKACDKWLDAGMFCTLYCSVGYDFTNKPPEFYYCGAEGKWLPRDKVPDCSKTREATTVLASELHYLADQCTEKMHSQIAINFIALYTMYLGTVGGCDENKKCTIENVGVQCGEHIGTLRRRDISDTKQSPKVPLTVKFALKVPLLSVAYQDDLKETIEQISSDILSALNEADLNLNISRDVLEYDTSKPPVFRFIGLVCDKGQILRRTKCETREATTVLASELHYLADQCTEEMHAQIASKFIAHYKQYLLTAVAVDENKKCTIENVEVECGEHIGTLRRRDISDSKKTSKVPFTVKFATKVPLPSNASKADLNETIEQISSDIISVLNQTDLNLNISGVVLEYDASKPPVFRLVGLVCDKGQVLRGTKCVNCPLGYFFNTTSCQACAVDQYQDQEAQSSCVSCPSGTSTFKETASKWSRDCQEIPTVFKTEGQDNSMVRYWATVGSIIGLLLVTVAIILFVRMRHPRLRLKYTARRPSSRTENNIGHVNPTYDAASIQDNEQQYMEIETFQHLNFLNFIPSFEPGDHFQRPDIAHRRSDNDCLTGAGKQKAYDGIHNHAEDHSVVFNNEACISKHIRSTCLARHISSQSETGHETDQNLSNCTDDSLISQLPRFIPKYITRAAGTFTSAGGELCAELDSDVRIIVDSDTIPVGIQQRIFFGVIYNEAEFLRDAPETSNTTLISPVIECGPHGIELLKPVRIILPHCLDLGKAKKEWVTVFRCELPLGHANGPLSWHKVPNKWHKSSQSKAWFAVEKDSIKIKAKTFSLWSVFACGGPKRKRAMVFSSQPDPKSDLIYLRFYVYSDNEDSKKRVERKDREAFPKSQRALEKPFKMYNDNNVIRVQLTELEEGWVCDKTGDTKIFIIERVNGHRFRSKDACEFAVKPQEGRDVNGFSCVIKFHQEDHPEEYEIYLNPGFTPLKRQSIRRSSSQRGRKDATLSGTGSGGGGSSSAAAEDKDLDNHNPEGKLRSPDSPSGQTEKCDHHFLSLDDEPVTETHCFSIQQQVGVDWIKVLRKLGMDDRMIRNLEEDYKNCDVAEKCYQALLAWKKKVGPQEATTKKLSRALRHAGCFEAVETLKEDMSKTSDC